MVVTRCSQHRRNAWITICRGNVDKTTSVSQKQCPQDQKSVTVPGVRPKSAPQALEARGNWSLLSKHSLPSNGAKASGNRLHMTRDYYSVGISRGDRRGELLVHNAGSLKLNDTNCARRPSIKSDIVITFMNKTERYDGKSIRQQWYNEDRSVFCHGKQSWSTDKPRYEISWNSAGPHAMAYSYLSLIFDT